MDQQWKNNLALKASIYSEDQNLKGIKEGNQKNLSLSWINSEKIPSSQGEYL